MGRMLGLFPPVVTGTVITLIGFSLMRVGINWAGGGQPTVRAVIDGVVRTCPTSPTATSATSPSPAWCWW